MATQQEIKRLMKLSQSKFKRGERVKYKDERVRVEEHIGNRVCIFIPSRQEEVWVKPKHLRR